MISPVRLAELTGLAAMTVESVRSALPDPVRAAAAECPAVLLTMEAWAEEEGEPEDPELMGMFTGMSRWEGSPSGPPEAPRILLFLDNLWAWCGEDRDCFREEVEVTFLHELGHYLGWDEDEVAERGLG